MNICAFRGKGKRLLARKHKTIYVCQQCGAESSKWEGKCTQCGGWNTMQEETRVAGSSKTKRTSSRARTHRSKPLRLGDISTLDSARISSNIEEFDRVLGGGILAGAVVLIAGEPGIGKSTLMLQAAAAYCAENREKDVLYISGEESPGQLRLRAERLGIDAANLYLLAETDIDDSVGQINAMAPLAVIVDSVQTLYAANVDSVPGSVGQLKECSARLVQVAKESGAPVFMIGHVTKSGAVAGPRLLEHLVDAVISFEGESQFAYRILRVIKNRFGPADEVGVFEMKPEGLVPVPNPAGIFIEQRAEGSAGAIIAPALEGTRPMLVEIQALTSFNGGFGAPRRSTSGVDFRRIALIIAVLEKRCGYRLYDQDVYVNIAGGIRVDETGADLPVALAIVSSFRNSPIEHDTIAVGEIGLGGELRPVRAIERRLSEARRLGFNKCILSHHQGGIKAFDSSLRILKARTLEEAIELSGLAL